MASKVTIKKDMFGELFAKVQGMMYELTPISETTYEVFRNDPSYRPTQWGSRVLVRRGLKIEEVREYLKSL